jgi:CelD/BcsL family acetyltransferase involved in cellulose biosynthesis
VHQPWALFLRQHGHLVGVVPLLVYPRGDERVLTLMGAGVSDDQDVILDPMLAGSALGTALLRVCAQQDRWDVCEFENLRPESPLVQAHQRLTWPRGRLLSHDTRVALALPEGLADLGQIIPKGLLKQVQYLRRRADRDGLPVSVDAATPLTFNAFFDDFARLHRMRWAARGHDGMLNAELEAFHRNAASRLVRHGLLRLYTLKLGDHTAAAFYGFSAKGRSLYYLSGFDPAFERYSPGSLIVAHAIERAVTEDHAHTFDFLRGREAYKRAWGATEQPLYRWSMRSPSLFRNR